MLGRSGHHIDIVGNGREAVEAVRDGAYDLVLMDIQMPEMGGIAATREIRDLPGGVGRVPIIALTANATEGDREKYMAAGMNDYVSKPLNVERLNEAIAEQCAPRPGTDHDAADLQKLSASLDDLMDQEE